MLRLDDLIGKKVMVCPINKFCDSDETGTVYTVTLHGVEAGGVWLESPELSKIAEGLAPHHETPVFFLPFSQIGFLLASSLALDEESFRA
jgi:hypothetical protein